MDDAETVPDSATLAGALMESFACEAFSDRLAAVAVGAWTSLHLFTLPPESVFTISLILVVELERPSPKKRLRVFFERLRRSRLHDRR